MITRRELLGYAAGAGAGLLVAGTDAWPALAANALPAPQAGIATDEQAKLDFAAFDVVVSGPEELRELLRSWTEIARRASASAADDRLTLTLGLGPSLFDGRYGLAPRRPRALAQLPAFRGDALRPARSGGDIAVQACAESPAAARAAINQLATAGRGAVTQRWRQVGFGRAGQTTRRRGTPRNLLGFKDGTANIHAGSRRAMRRFVWARQPDWMAGGTYLVARKIRMRLHEWSALSMMQQERAVGRMKRSGAPLGGRHELDPPDLHARHPDGRRVIPSHAHIRLASPSHNGGRRILRRGYSYDDGVQASGQRDAGLFFISFQRDPELFVALQRALTEGHDELLEYVVHESSAVFACPPAARPSGFIGEGLF